jgi:hypothetical protein
MMVLDEVGEKITDQKYRAFAQSPKISQQSSSSFVERNVAKETMQKP